MGSISHESRNGLNGTDSFTPPTKTRCAGRENTFYPKEIENDLDGFPGLSDDFICETLATSWEYARSVIPVYTNWDRYLAFTRTIITGIIAEVNSTLVDVLSDDFALSGYTLDDMFDILFSGTPGQGRDEMARDYRTFLLTTAEKTGNNRNNSELFRRYVDCLAESPQSWFRIRDADALIRFSIASSLTCNDALIWFTPSQWDILGEIACTLYDAVAFYKHRAEGETNNTFAYVDPCLRDEAYRRAREVLWALDAAWARSPGHLCAVNFVRLIGGPIHMMMRRYRFVEEGLTIGRVETEDVVRQTREHVKLWNRVDLMDECGGCNGGGNGGSGRERYLDVIEQRDKFLFEGLAELLEMQTPGRERCEDCVYRTSYGSERLGQFGGVRLCGGCKEAWRVWIESLPQRAWAVFPELDGHQLLFT